MCKFAIRRPIPKGSCHHCQSHNDSIWNGIWRMMTTELTETRARIILRQRLGGSLDPSMGRVAKNTIHVASYECLNQQKPRFSAVCLVKCYEILVEDGKEMAPTQRASIDGRYKTSTKHSTEDFWKRPCHFFLSCVIRAFVFLLLAPTFCIHRM